MERTVEQVTVDLEDDGYVGEVARRRPVVAALLSILMPGLGHIYAGAVYRGFAIYLSAFLLSVAVATVTYQLRVFFLKPLVGWALLLLYAQVWVVRDVLRLVRRRRESYVLRPYNHPLVYAGTFLLLLCVPTWFLAEFSSAYLIGNVVVQDVGMVPRLVRGDRLYFDRAAYAQEPPSRGDLVVVEGAVGQPRVLRVVGVPGDVVGVRRGAVVLNDQVLPQERLGSVAVTDRGLERDAAHLVGYAETSDGGPYEVFYDSAAVLLDTGPVYVGSDSYFLLADNRTGEHVVDSRQLGAVPRDDISGRPLYVWFSRDSETGAVRWSRVGLRVQ